MSKIKWWLTRSFYALTKCYYQDQRTATHRAFYYLDAVVFALMWRFLLRMYVMYKDYQTSFDLRKYDPIMNYFYLHSDIYDAFIPAIFFLFGAFTFKCLRLLYNLDTKEKIWKFWYYLSVTVRDDYDRCLLSKEDLKKMIAEKRNRLLEEKKWLGRFSPSSLVNKGMQASAWYNFDMVDKSRMLTMSSWPIFRNASPHLRLKLLRFILPAEKLVCFFQITKAFFISALVIMLISDFYALYPWYFIAMYVPEFLACVYFSFRFMQCGIIFALSATSSAIVFPNHCKYVQTPIVRSIWKPKRGKKIENKMRGMLHHFLREHNRVCYIVMKCGEGSFNNVSFAFLLSNIPVNIYIIRRIVFVKDEIQMSLVMALIVTMQAAASSIVFVPLASLGLNLHRSKDWICSLQFRILRGRKWLRHKLKFDDLYQRMTTDPKIGVTMGPDQVVTYMAIFEFIMMYVGYLLMAFSQQIEANVEKLKTENST